MNNEPIAILGAGPAGLSAAYELTKRGVRPLVFEKTDQVGGIARTESYKGYLFDIGGHRFFTKIERINRLWQEMLGESLLNVPRMSRIYYQGRFYTYPIAVRNALSNLGVTESLLILTSYVAAQIRPCPEENTFEQWVSNRFGRRLYEKFFQTYTEKVWGIPCTSIRADWAAQRIKGLSLMAALANALLGNQKAKSLINEFLYPARGPGMMWQRFQEEVEAGGGQIVLNSEAFGLRRNDRSIAAVTLIEKGEKREIPVGHVISSIPITKLVTMIEPEVPDEVIRAAAKLAYRGLILVGLIVDKKDLFPDQWIYVHNPDVRVGRIQNFKNWSAEMVPDPWKTSIGLEYFCTEGDEIWKMPDGELIEFGSRELSELGLAELDDVVDGFVVRQPAAYPVYGPEYAKHLKVIRDFLEPFHNLQTIGRNGMHRYNNMDHSMYTGILAADNALGADHVLWEVNEEAEYLEETKREDAAPPIPEKLMMTVFARMDKLAFATATGTVSGLLFFLAPK